MNITDPIRRRAHANPDAEAIIRPNGKAVSYGQLDRTIDFVAARVQGLGLAPGAIVGVRTDRPYRNLCCRLALARLGICIAPLSMPAIATCLIDGAMPDEPGAKFERIDRLWPVDLAPATDVPEVPSHQDGAAVCAIFPTSGTTGIPKHVAASHDLMARRISTIPSALRLPNDARLICTIGAGTGYGFLRRLTVLWNGGAIVMITHAAQILPSIGRHRVNRLVMAPFALQRLLQGLPPDFGPPPSLQQIETGGSALPDRLYDIARQRLCANIVSQYGAAEAGPVAVATMLSLQGHPGAVGYLYPGVEMQAVDADDQPLPPGTEGTLRVRSGGCASGYFDDPAASARVFRGGWVYPGDVGTVAGDGLVTVTGRSSEVINQGGVKINPQLIENVLLSVPEIAEAAAFGVPDALGLTRIWAAIVPSGPVDMSAVKALCREQLKNSAPASFLQLKALPRNEFGKVLREPLQRKAIRASAKRVASAGNS